MKRLDREAFARAMRDHTLPELSIATFLRHLERLEAGESAWLREDAIDAVAELPDFAAMESLDATGRAALSRCVVIKLNGGLATSMGLTRAKSLLPVRGDMSFLDIIARHVGALRERYKAPLPLLLMNSFRTQADSLERLVAHAFANPDLPLDFLQHRVPKIDVERGAPARSPGDPELAWCPPGHGDLYTALQSTGLLETLLTRGFRYAFVSNADNLGATLEPRVLGHLVAEKRPFLMEVTGRSHGDRKGGHLARSAVDGSLLLRESAQCHPDDKVRFEDVSHHRYFNTNNLWVDLEALRDLLAENDGILELPMIQNQKTVDPRDPTSTAVIQLETAMGSAISVFPGASAVAVPRDRFAPVKTTNDLLAIRSDAYTLTTDFRVIAAAGSTAETLHIELDPATFGRIDRFEARFPEGPPSLRECRSLCVVGDVVFSEGVRCVGKTVFSQEGAGVLRVAPGTYGEV